MSTNIEAIAFVLVGAADSTDQAGVRFQNDAGFPVFAKLIAGRQPGRTTAGDDGVIGGNDGDRRRIINPGPTMGNDAGRRISDCGRSTPMNDSSFREVDAILSTVCTTRRQSIHSQSAERGRRVLA